MDNRIGHLDHLLSRFNVESGHLREDPLGGIVLDASRIDLGDHVVAMALIADLSGVDGGRNNGASASNSLDIIISTYRGDLLSILGAEDVLWVELDSMGCFDAILARPRDGALDLHWTPLLSGDYYGRTESDFVALYGFHAERAMANVRRAALWPRWAVEAR